MSSSVLNPAFYLVLAATFACSSSDLVNSSTAPGLGESCACEGLPPASTTFGVCSGSGACAANLTCVVASGEARCYGEQCCSSASCDDDNRSTKCGGRVCKVFSASTSRFGYCQ